MVEHTVLQPPQLESMATKPLHASNLVSQTAFSLGYNRQPTMQPITSFLHEANTDLIPPPGRFPQPSTPRNHPHKPSNPLLRSPTLGEPEQPYLPWYKQHQLKARLFGIKQATISPPTPRRPSDGMEALLHLTTSPSKWQQMSNSETVFGTSTTWKQRPQWPLLLVSST